MQPNYQSALNGTLASTLVSVTPYSCSITNYLALTISLYQVLSDGTLDYINDFGPLSNYSATLNNSGHYFILNEASTGAFIGVVAVVSQSGTAVNISVDDSYLCTPNDMGTVPQPSLSFILPVDSPSVLVGYFNQMEPTPISVYREQYWSRSSDSYSLGVGETKTVSYSSTAGIEQTSSELTTVATALSGSATASAGWGWGSVSATISAGINQNSTKMQQVTMRTETTNYVSETYANTTTAPMVVLKWQLIDRYTVFNQTGMVLVGSVSVGQSPLMVQTAYNPSSFSAIQSHLLSQEDRRKEIAGVQGEAPRPRPVKRVAAKPAKPDRKS